MFNVYYNNVMSMKSRPKKEFTVGFRVTREQKERLSAVVARVKLINPRVEASEVYEELMSLKEREFIVDRDRNFLLGRINSLEPLKVAGKTKG